MGEYNRVDIVLSTYSLKADVLSVSPLLEWAYFKLDWLCSSLKMYEILIWTKEKSNLAGLKSLKTKFFQLLQILHGYLKLTFFS